MQAPAENIDAWYEDVRTRIDALESWFLDLGSIELLVQEASNALQKVIHRAWSQLRPVRSIAGLEC